LFRRGFMASFRLLDRAAGDFKRPLRLVTVEQHPLPTPCGEWTVYDLVSHQIGGMRMYAELLAGGSREAALTALNSGLLGSNWVETFEIAYRAMFDAFSEPGALGRTVQHPNNAAMPATMLFRGAVGELALHGWDLARAIGADEELDDEVVAEVWSFYSSVSASLGTSGIFGSGASGTVPESASLQTRLLDVSGRRP
jgi:uncharacterized protein (TIGR03086 family)